jgi:hypothetical protein
VLYFSVYFSQLGLVSVTRAAALNVAVLESGGFTNFGLKGRENLKGASNARNRDLP